MKFFTIIFFAIAVASMANADDDSHSHCSGLAYLLGPVLALLQPLLNGVNCGLQAGSTQVAKGVHQLGNTLQSTVSGVGTIVANTAAGAGGTVKDLPAGLYKTTKNLQKHTGVVGNVIDTLTGPVSSSHSHHCHHSTSSM